MKLSIEFIGLLLLVSLGSAQIPEDRICPCVEQYFRLNRKGPTLVSAKIINDARTGRTMKVHIIARRHSSSVDLGFAFAAAAAVSNLAAEPISQILVQMDINYKECETTMALAPASCTIGAMILGDCRLVEWWDNCLEFL